MKKLDKKAYVEQAYHTSCQAHFREDFFSFQEGEMGQEYYRALSFDKLQPQWEFIDDGTDDIQGTFYFLTESASDLYLMCNYYAEEETPYYVFFHSAEKGDNNPSGWVIWLPESKLGKGNELR
jgi:hypothetical protein